MQTYFRASTGYAVFFPRCTKSGYAVFFPRCTKSSHAVFVSWSVSSSSLELQASADLEKNDVDTV